jgi:DNA invertase Pin-like site-specific DNA recombinase
MHPQHTTTDRGRRLRVVIYIRVSSRSQEDRNSLTVQLADCRRHAQTDGWEIVAEFCDVESGLNIERDQYQEMLTLIRSGAVDVVLIWKLDRFGRDDGEAITRSNEMDRMRVKLVSAREGELDPLTRGILFVVAKQESRNTAMRTKPGLRQHVSEGRWPASPPFGYRMVPGQRGLLQVYEPEAVVVREMFRRYADGGSLTAIRDWLDTQSVRPRRAAYFSASWVDKVLRNQVYRGYIEYDRLCRSRLFGSFARPESERMLVPGVHDALVPEGLWQQVQERRAARARGLDVANNNSGQFLLTGILRCGVCGFHMYGKYNNAGSLRAAGKPMRGYMYRCTRAHHPMANGARLDAFVLDALASFPVGADAAAAVQELLDAEAAMRPARRRDLEAAKAQHIARRKRASMLLIDERMTQDSYDEAIIEIDAALGLVERELAALEPAPEAAPRMKQAAGWLALVGHLGAMPVELELAERADLVRACMEAVTYQGNEAEPELAWQEWAAAVRERAEIMANGSTKNAHHLLRHR